MAESEGDYSIGNGTKDDVYKGAWIKIDGSRLYFQRSSCLHEKDYQNNH